MDPQSRLLLQELVRRESRSLLRYVGEAFPWTTERARGNLADLHQIVTADQQSLNALIRLLGKHKVGLPHLGAYPNWFTTINFVSLKHLVPLLVEAQRMAIVNLEQDLAAVRNEEIRNHLAGMIEQKRAHLKKLEALAPADEVVARAG